MKRVQAVGLPATVEVSGVEVTHKKKKKKKVWGNAGGRHAGEGWGGGGGGGWGRSAFAGKIKKKKNECKKGCEFGGGVCDLEREGSMETGSKFARLKNHDLY